MSGDDVVAWVERNLTLEAGAPLNLEPWQRAILERWSPPSPERRAELIAEARSSGRRRRMARAIAGSLIYADGPVCISCPDARSAAALLDAVRDELQTWGRLLNADVTRLLEGLTVHVA